MQESCLVLELAGKVWTGQLPAKESWPPQHAGPVGLFCIMTTRDRIRHFQSLTSKGVHQAFPEESKATWPLICLRSSIVSLQLPVSFFFFFWNAER